MKKEKIIDYDSKFDTLLVSMRKSRTSVEIGDYIIDLDSKNYVGGMEILNASQNLHVPKTFLENINKAKFLVKYTSNMVMINLVLMTVSEPLEKHISFPLMVSLGHKEKEEKTTIPAAIAC
jgi:uncharacterized protein YuzE